MSPRSTGHACSWASRSASQGSGSRSLRCTKAGGGHVSSGPSATAQCLSFRVTVLGWSEAWAGLGRHPFPCQSPWLGVWMQGQPRGPGRKAWLLLSVRCVSAVARSRAGRWFQPRFLCRLFSFSALPDLPWDPRRESRAARPCPQRPESSLTGPRRSFQISSPGPPGSGAHTLPANLCPSGPLTPLPAPHSGAPSCPHSAPSPASRRVPPS